MPPDGITIDIAGTEHLFGGEEGLAEQVEDDFAAQGMQVRIAAAKTAQQRTPPAMQACPAR